MAKLIEKRQLENLQIKDSDIAIGANIATSKLVDGSKLIKSDGTVVFLANQSMGGFKLTSVGSPTVPTDVIRLQELTTLRNEKGQPNGYPSLDGGGKIPASQLPNSVMELQGSWNASTNTPTLIDGTGNPGDVYQVTTAGTQNLGSGSITYAIGDFVIYGSSGVWFKSLNSNAVTSVFGRTGIVTAVVGDYSAFYPLLNGTGATGTWGISITGNSATATVLQTARTINGVSFNGSANITIADATKEPIIAPGTTAQYWRGDKSWQTLNSAAVGLGNVNNTSDLAKPISTATQSALDGKQNTLGFTPENVANKATSLASPDNTKYPTTLAVANAIPVDTDDLPEGTTNLYSTTTRIRAALSAGTGITYVAATGVITNSSPNLQANLALGTRTATTLPITNSDGTGVTLPIATTTLAGLQSAADKLKLDGIATGATANTGTVTSVVSGNGLVAGTITTSGTITLGTPSDVTLSSTNSVTATSHTHAFTPGGTTAQYIRGDGSLATLPAPGTGTVTSVAMSVPTGLTIGGTPITTSGTLALTYTAGYAIPTLASQTNWDTAFSWGDYRQFGLGASAVTTDYNTIPSYTLYRNNALSVANAPTAGVHSVWTSGTTTTLNATGLGGQLAIGYSNAGGNYTPAELYIRSKASATTWNTWDQIATRAWANTTFAPIAGGAYLPLAGGTLTGALGGTNASFTGMLTSAGITMLNNNNFASAPFSFVAKNSGSDNTLYTYTPAAVALAIGLGNYLPLAGGTLTGTLNGTTGNFSASVVSTGGAFTVNRAAGNIRGMFAQTTNVNRWHWGANTTAETGSQSGSDWTLERYSDAGANLGQAINVQRSTGNITFSGTVAGLSTASFTGNVTAATLPTLDAHLVNLGYLNTSLGDYLPLTGGTLTGGLNGTTAVFSSSVYAGQNVTVSGAAATTRSFQIRTGTLLRWLLYADTGAESGANAGSTFAIARYTDAGAFLGNPLSINRATGTITFKGIQKTERTNTAQYVQIDAEGGSGNILSKNTLNSGYSTINIIQGNNVDDRNVIVIDGTGKVAMAFAASVETAPTASTDVVRKLELDTKAPLTGVGTSGTWPISITGNAVTATTSTNSLQWKGVFGRIDEAVQNAGIASIIGVHTNGDAYKFSRLALETFLDIPSGGYLPLSAGLSAPLTDQLLINKAGGLALSMKNISGAVGNLYIDFRNNANTRLGYIGFGSASNNNLSIFNDLGANLYNATSHTFNSQVIGTTGSFTGNMVVANGIVTGAAAANRGYYLQTATVNRWSIVENNTAESGSNVGSDFVINRWDDAGTTPTATITVNRATGASLFGGTVETKTLGVTGTTNYTYPTLGTIAATVQIRNGISPIGAYGLGIGVWNDGNTWMQAGRFDATATAYNIIMQSAGGNVGIGTTTPGVPLHVKGQFRTERVAAAQYTQIDSEAGATTILTKNMVNAVYAQMLFSQGNSTTDREMARFDTNGNFIMAIGSITSNLTGNATTATTLQTARTINGVSFNGSANITIPVGTGTVTSVASTVAGNALTVPATAITTSGTLAYTWAGSATQYITGQGNLANLNTTNVLEGGNLYYTDARAIAAPLTGYVTGSNTALSASETILTAFGKVQGQLNAKAPLTGTGTSGTWPIAITGNSATATTLQTARTINGVSFDGSANITISAVTSVASTMGGNALGVTGTPITTSGTLVYAWAGTAAQYITGQGNLATLNTTAVVEGSNLYFTNARTIAATLTGYAVGANTALVAADNVLGAFQKVQGQLNAKLNLSGGTLTGALSGTTASFSGLITASTVPTAGGHLTNKTYVDSLALWSTITGVAIGPIAANSTVRLASNSNDATYGILDVRGTGSTPSIRVQAAGSSIGVESSVPGGGIGVYGYAASGTGLRGDTSTGIGLVANKVNTGGNIAEFSLNGTTVTWIATDGSVSANGGFFDTSDITLKTVVDKKFNVSTLKPIAYSWKDKSDNKVHYGYSAQEVQKYMPDAVRVTDDGILSVNYVEVLVAKVEMLEQQIKELKANL